MTDDVDSTEGQRPYPDVNFAEVPPPPREGRGHRARVPLTVREAKEKVAGRDLLASYGAHLTHLRESAVSANVGTDMRAAAMEVSLINSQLEFEQNRRTPPRGSTPSDPSYPGAGFHATDHSWRGEALFDEPVGGEDEEYAPEDEYSRGYSTYGRLLNAVKQTVKWQRSKAREKYSEEGTEGQFQSASDLSGGRFGRLAAQTGSVTAGLHEVFGGTPSSMSGFTAPLSGSSHNPPPPSQTVSGSETYPAFKPLPPGALRPPNQ